MTFASEWLLQMLLYFLPAVSHSNRAGWNQYDLKHHPASRRILTNLYNFTDLHEMALYPCAYSMTFNVSGHPPSAPF